MQTRYIHIEDRLYKVSEKIYKQFHEMIDGQELDPSEWADALEFVEDNGTFVTRCEHFCY